MNERTNERRDESMTRANDLPRQRHLPSLKWTFNFISSKFVIFPQLIEREAKKKMMKWNDCFISDWWIQASKCTKYKSTWQWSIWDWIDWLVQQCSFLLAWPSQDVLLLHLVSQIGQEVGLLLVVLQDDLCCGLTISGYQIQEHLSVIYLLVSLSLNRLALQYSLLCWLGKISF